MDRERPLPLDLTFATLTLSSGLLLGMSRSYEAEGSCMVTRVFLLAVGTCWTPSYSCVSLLSTIWWDAGTCVQSKQARHMLTCAFVSGCVLPGLSALVNTEQKPLLHGPVR